MVSGTRCPCECVWICDGERGSGPEGADDLCLVILEALCWDLSLEARGCNLSLEAGIGAIWPDFQPQGWILGSEARFLTLRLDFGLSGWNLRLEAGI